MSPQVTFLWMPSWSGSMPNMFYYQCLTPSALQWFPSSPFFLDLFLIIMSGLLGFTWYALRWWVPETHSFPFPPMMSSHSKCLVPHKLIEPMWRSFWCPELQTYGHYGCVRRLEMPFTYRRILLTTEQILAVCVRTFLQTPFHANQDKKRNVFFITDCLYI